jgi:uncharacterized membrane protein
MLQGYYRRRLSEDLPGWQANGWVTPQGQVAILNALDSQRSSFGLATVIGILGGLLIGIGVIAFVAANWQEMPRLLRFFTLLLAMALAYGVGAVLRLQKLFAFSEAAVLVAGLIFAAAIGLIGQTYHLAGDFSGAVLLWNVGILAAALIIRSPTLTVLGIVGAGYWTWLGTFDNDIVPHWPGLALIIIAAAIATWLNRGFLRVCAVLALLWWAWMTNFELSRVLDWPAAGGLTIGAATGLVFWSLGQALDTLKDGRLAALGRVMLWPGLVVLLLAVAALQTAVHWDDWLFDGSEKGWLFVAAPLLIAAVVFAVLAYFGKAITAIDVLAVALIGAAAIAYTIWSPPDHFEGRLASGLIVVVAALWAVSLGQTGRQGVGKTTGLVFFGIEVLYLYSITLGTVLDTAIAFLVGGVLFIVLAFILFRIDRRLTAQHKTRLVT